MRGQLNSNDIQQPLEATRDAVIFARAIKLTFVIAIDLVIRVSLPYISIFEISKEL